MNSKTKRIREKRVRDNACDICGADAGLVHEIARGVAHRPKALLANFATLILCSPCHDLRIHKGMSVAEQLAYLYHRRPDEFDLEKFYRLTARRWPSMRDIWIHVRRIRNAEDARRTW